jgi:hypothetical protein
MAPLDLVSKPTDPTAFGTEDRQPNQHEQNALQHGEEESYEAEPEEADSHEDLYCSPNRMGRFSRQSRRCAFFFRHVGLFGSPSPTSSSNAVSNKPARKNFQVYLGRLVFHNRTWLNVTGKNEMPRLLRALVLLSLLAIAVVAIGMALPLIRYLYERPAFLWVSMVSAVAVGLFLVIAPVRARTSLRRKVIFSGSAAGVALVQVANVYLDFGAPSLWTPGPEILVVFREMVHILLYGFLAFTASRLLKTDLGGRALAITAFAYAFTAGIVDETVQWLHAFRVGDLRDVHLNGISAAAGLLYGAALAPLPRSQPTRTGRLLMTLFLIVLPLLYVEFYLRTQTGHRICNASDNCFTSHFSTEELADEVNDRTARWKLVPTGALAGGAVEPRFWAFEDYFLTEARAHFRLANEAAAVGDWGTACPEIQILVEFYPPSVRAMGVRPQDYNCPNAARGFRSQAFGHLGTRVRHGRWRLYAVLVSCLLAGVTWFGKDFFTQSRRTAG